MHVAFSTQPGLPAEDSCEYALNRVKQRQTFPLQRAPALEKSRKQMDSHMRNCKVSRDSVLLLGCHAGPGFDTLGWKVSH